MALRTAEQYKAGLPPLQPLSPAERRATARNRRTLTRFKKASASERLTNS